VESFHNTLHWADGVLVIQEVCGKFGFSVAIFEVTEVFIEMDFEQSSCLTNIFHFAYGACQPVDPTVLVFISSMLVLRCQKFSYCVISGEGYFDISVLE
jgi:hypothetical protein